MQLLEKTANEKLKNIAIPALGTGTLQFPRDTVAKIMVQCVEIFGKAAATKNSLKKVSFVAFDLDKPMIQAFENALKNVNGAGADGSTNDVNTDSGNIRRAAASTHSLIDLDDKDIHLGDVVMEIRCGDITRESADAIVVLGNKNIDLLGAVGNAIKNAEGEEFAKQVKYISPQDEGTTKMLKTFKLPSKYVAHVYPTSHSYEDLKEATKKMFEKCNSKKLKSVSLPAIGTGIIGKTPEESARLILQSFVELSLKKEVPNIQKLSIILYEERLVSAFKKELANILKDPEKCHKDQGIIAWIRDKVKFVQTFFSRNPSNERAAQASSKAKDGGMWTSVVWNVYGALERKAFKEIEEKMTSMFDDNITSSEVKKELFKNLSPYLFDKIQSFANKRDVSVELEKSSGTMKFIGFHRDTAEVVAHCHEVSSQSAEEEQRKEKEQTVANYVQWKEKQKDGSIFNYDPVANCLIETHYKEQNNDAYLDMEDDDKKTYRFKLDFSNQDEMKVINTSTNEEKIILREELGKTASSSK